MEIWPNCRSASASAGVDPTPRRATPYLSCYEGFRFVSLFTIWQMKSSEYVSTSVGWGVNQRFT